MRQGRGDAVLQAENKKICPILIFVKRKLYLCKKNLKQMTI